MLTSITLSQAAIFKKSVCGKCTYTATFEILTVSLNKLQTFL